MASSSQLFSQLRTAMATDDGSRNSAPFVCRMDPPYFRHFVVLTLGSSIVDGEIGSGIAGTQLCLPPVVIASWTDQFDAIVTTSADEQF